MNAKETKVTLLKNWQLPNVSSGRLVQQSQSKYKLIENKFFFRSFLN